MKKQLFLLSLIALAPSVAMAASVEQGKTLFAQRCASCHGETGGGDGPVAASLPPEMKPRNLQEAKFKVVTDDAKFHQLLKVGGAGMGLSPIMPPQPDLSDDDVQSVWMFVKSLKK